METPTVQSPIELKIKAKSLAAEARIIRQLEKRLKRRFKPLKGKKNRGKFKERPGLRDERTATVFFKIQSHRKFEVRTEARATHLARAFLKGRPYTSLELTTYSAPPLDSATKIATRYAEGDPRIIAQRLAEWIATAKAHWEDQEKVLKALAAPP